MLLLEAVRLALVQLRVQKLKSGFTLLGVAIGVMFLIAVVSVVEGMGRYMEHDLIGKLMVVNSFQVRRQAGDVVGDIDEDTEDSYRRRPDISEQDTASIVGVLPPGFMHAVISSSSIPVSSRYVSSQSVEVRNVTHEYFAIRNLQIVSGRTFSEQEDALHVSVAVIGQDVQEHFFPGLDPLGRDLRIGGVLYRVIGVAEKQGSTFGISLDRFVIVPYGTPAKRLTSPATGVIESVLIQAPSPTAQIAGEEAVRQVLRARHNLHPMQRDDFTLETADSTLAFWNKIKGYLVIAGIALPMIGLIVGAIVIMNIMLVSVVERTREIGIRKSLGARSQDILLQFLIESATLSTVGALLGIGLGIGIAWLVSVETPLPTSVAPWSLAAAIVLGMGVGIVAGVYPASRAARLDPIVALHTE